MYITCLRNIILGLTAECIDQHKFALAKSAHALELNRVSKTEPANTHVAPLGHFHAHLAIPES